MQTSIEWEIFFICLTSLFPIWLFNYHPMSKLSFEKQIAYHIMNVPFYLFHYFFLYCFAIDFILSAVCNVQDTAFCRDNYDNIRFSSLYIALIFLVLTTISQVIDALDKPRSTIESKLRKKRKDIRKSVENMYNYLGGFKSKKDKQKAIRKSINRREKQFKGKRQSFIKQWDGIRDVELKILQLEETDGYVSLKSIYKMIDEIDSITNRKKLENQLHTAVSKKVDRNKNASYKDREPIYRMVKEIRDEQIRYWMLRLLKITQTV